MRPVFVYYDERLYGEKMKCHTCKELVPWREQYGPVFPFSKVYCKKHWFRFLVEEAEEEVAYWKREYKSVCSEGGR